ncbi:Imm8 family immunity protein [Colwellia sp. E2M01]|uniref:Imm8 family immunity protein n=1 Tax=Colwellia sp. E2M01 TaxID=2841561 RepID=UPI001C08150D|nr:Imm8 family immunity protein [Colwellia sp. E2M01]MBU2872058.1 immunity 8 family protein [Colwellia sp. E2M01]
MKKKLVVSSICSSEVDVKNWQPISNDDVYICLDIKVDFPDENQSGHLFYVTLATIESIKKNRSEPYLVINRTIVISEYSYELVSKLILDIIETCSKSSWEESCIALQRYFQWEYEDYSLE